MSSLDKDAWQRVSELLDQLLALPEAERSPGLERLNCDESTRKELRRLLAASRKSTQFLESPARTHPSGNAVDSIAPGSRIGAYCIDAFLARGGMSEVYRARRADGQFEKPVAFKLSRSETSVGPGRFHNERQILASLEHPGIARLIDGGLTAEGLPYMVMELVDGRDVLSYCRQHQLDLQQRLALFAQVCEAVGYAHRHLVIHRDLKPSNILVDNSGRVKLLDFGIAKLLGTGMLPEGQSTLAMMTPEYAAPEQLEGKSATTATDVYALGVLLYQLLSGRPPWNLRQLPLPAALQRLLHTDPEPLSQAARNNPDAPIPAKLLAGDLDAIVAKALRREPEARYTSAQALWNDVQSHLAHRPVLARGDARGYLVQRFLRRNRLWAGAAAAVFVALLLGLTGTLWQAHEARKEAHHAELERDCALAEASHAQSMVDYVDLVFGSTVEQAGRKSISAKDVLDASTEQLMQGLAGKPVEKARAMQAFGDLYLTMHDFEGAGPILSRFLESSEADAAPDIRAHIELDLAYIEQSRGNVDTAQRLLIRAQDFWSRDADKYRGQMIQSRSTQAQIQAARGDLDGAIRTLRDALSESTAFNGETARDTLVITGDLGAILMQNNQLEEADRMMKRAWNALQAAGRGQTEEAIALLNNIAVNAIRRNDLPRAEKLLRQVIDMRRQTFSPSAELAAQENNLGKVLLLSGRPRDSIPLLDDALGMARHFTGDHSQLAIRVLQSAAEARLAMKDAKAAEPLVQSALDGAKAEFGEHSLTYGISLSLEAKLRFLQGNTAEANSLADKSNRILVDAGDAGKYYLQQLQQLQQQMRGT